MVSDTCYHCALPIPDGCNITVDIEGGAQPVCCPGCKAVAELIRDSGMGSYYSVRETPQPGVGRPPDEAGEWDVFNSDDMLSAFSTGDQETADVTVYVGGMYCSACSWLIESTMSKLPGIETADVNPVAHRLRLRWHPEQMGLGDMLGSLARLGYEPQPLTPDSGARPELIEQRASLKRLLVASLGMMQAMMFAVGLYAGDYQGIDPDMQHFLRLVSFFVTTPVVFYSARPFFSGALRGLRARQPGMDVPVSIAVGAAYVASVYATFTRGPAVWFDSVTMFVFFLTLGRFLEMRARHRSIDRGAALSSLLPNTATRRDGDSRQVVPVSQLVAGDVVIVRAGDAIPADGVITRGDTTVDEALLTGETTPLQRGVGDPLTAGSVNIDGNVEMRVERTGNATTLGTISRLSEQARFARPAFVQLADRIASYIVVALLVVAASVAVFWYFADPERAFVITLSVLVVTCPCALALATPAAFAAAGARLSQLHLLVTDGNAIEVLSKATHVIFDKTGTLTRGEPAISSVDILDANYDEAKCRRIAAALESASSHPLAHAFVIEGVIPAARDLRVVVGRGVSGTVDGRRWRIGHPEFVTGGKQTRDNAHTRVCLGTDGKAVATFTLEDELRRDAKETVQVLRNAGLGVSLLSGDGARPVARVAEALEITEFAADCSPSDKLASIKRRQAKGEIVVMVGDGINDAPVLAGADTSVALAHGAMLAQTNADVIMPGESLSPVVTGIRVARKTMRIVRQNLAWAIVYNATALPLAAMGFVPPWAAAIGMSASSLVVVMNALRLGRFGKTSHS
jgi:Cu2+-exporting ATPase